MLRRLLRFFSKSLAMDLGTANTLIYSPKTGIVLNEPSVVALDIERNSVLAVGKEAKEFLGRTPRSIKAIRPMRDGVIADFEVTRQMISYFLKKTITTYSFGKPRLVVCVPSGITQVEKRAVLEAAGEAGARDIHLIEEPMAAALGAGLPVHEPKGSLVVDIGGGTTEVAVISLSAIAYSESVRMAGDAMDAAIQRYFQNELQMLIGENMAERIKKTIGSAYPLKEQLVVDVAGKDIISGTPKSVRISDGHIREALAEPVKVILLSIRKALEKTPPELSADIGNSGILLAGGGALLQGLSEAIHQDTGIPVFVDNDPLTSVVRGTGLTLEDPGLHSKVYVS
ncbi:rod shape-determining protein [Desulfovibrio litoralis]|uniref:Cell shape-determining protein MreB n=1 Tax=Desulfovibrio litoralis DSM 11393 TaxID=1121455 RepID=A0A1M7TG06_9BACT|nr:rod shape-determining protein [Desulfovibrio litoralis]SHN69645.1 rod shape-determining protein MreB [Desulfovibrio litoralis DSM 11393]